MTPPPPPDIFANNQVTVETREAVDIYPKEARPVREDTKLGVLTKPAIEESVTPPPPDIFANNHETVDVREAVDIYP